MTRQQCRIRALPQFEKDLENASKYISEVLCNEAAANILIEEIKDAIVKRSSFPLLFRPYPLKKRPKDAYYPIYVRNYIIFYVVIGDVMEIRRLLYKRRKISRILNDKKEEKI